MSISYTDLKTYYDIWGSFNVEDDEEDEELEDMAMVVASCYQQERSSALYRRRWDDNYLINLAIQEGSFVSEYRLDLKSFDVLETMLRSDLEKIVRWLEDRWPGVDQLQFQLHRAWVQH